MPAPSPVPDPTLPALVGLLGARTDLRVLTEGHDRAETLSSADSSHLLDRVIALPVSDRATAAVAVAMAWSGRPVIVEIADESRLTAIVAALDDAARWASGDRALALVVRVPLLRGAAGVAAVRAIAGLRVWCARDRSGAPLGPALAAGGPVVLLEPADVPDALGEPGDVAVPATVRRAPSHRPHATVVACGAAVAAALTAARALEAEGLAIEVIDAVAVSPVPAGIGVAVQATGRLVVASGIDAAWGDRVVQRALGPAFLYLEAPPATCGADVEAIVAAVRAVVHY